ncbi:flagellar protein FliS [Sodalis-like endosymbiont of Proechinophthirus fluctus]|uniref:flagellar export chaperone FliS n=1 Tax=Sodalis-like endosymbiont of Proechinophthirus fluctus TaxID=1462730 RepID=UPI0007A8B14D|nr:flagellar export chaperone FliS [Sodalis-like endosymbiont of Proechinophthirus fluctus]KYP96949.1 flagellar protein FliS [Sodalis-like endosymbiont of Proechinophthirus fluctus]
MSADQGINAYQQISLQTDIAGATPHQLIVMLFDGAHSALAQAGIWMARGNIARRGEEVSRAIAIIECGLLATLDYEKGKTLAQDLANLYRYMIYTLLKANLNNDPEAIKHVDALLKKISSAWKEITPQR